MLKASSPARLILALALVLPHLPLTARAARARDTITGTLVGRVIDQGGTPIPGARIRVINQDTGNARATLTGGDGRYQITFLPLGRYTIEATKDGLSVLQPTKEPIKIQLNKVIETAPDIIMAAAGSTPPPPGPAGPPGPPGPPGPVAPPAAAEESSGKLVNLVDATRRANADERMVSLLPLPGVRTFDDLAFLAPGVAPPPEVKGVAGPGIGAGIGTAGQFAVNGERARSNNFTVDGSDNNDEDVGVRRQGFVSLVPQSIESVQEFQIVTQLWDAELGRNLGSQVNAVSRAGGNRVHGALYDFFNHSALNARNFFDYTTGQEQSYPLTAPAYDRFVNGQPATTQIYPVRIDGVPVVQANPSDGENQYQRNQGGGVIGFPLYRDRTFFFGSFERQDIKARQETHFAVPNVAQRGFLNFGASGFTATDVNGDQQGFFPTFVAGDSVFSLFPLANNPVGPYGDNTFTQVLPADGHGTIFSLKLDHNFTLFGPGVTHTLTGRYNFTDDERLVPAVGGAIFSGLEPQVRTQNFSLFLNSQISPTLANQLRASYGRTRLRFDERRDPYLSSSTALPGEPFLLNSGLLVNLSSGAVPFADYQRASAARTAESSLGPLGQVNVTPFSPVGLDVYLFPQARANNTIQFADTLTQFRGNHTLKYGLDVRRTQLNSVLNRNYRPQAVFGGSPDFTGMIGGAPIPNLSQSGPTPGFFSGTDLASLGIPTGIFQSLTLGAPDSTIGLRSWQFNFFVNDNFRVRPGLTFDYGLRYEYNTVPREVNDRIEETFKLDSLPAVDPSLSIAVPFTPGLVFDTRQLLASLNSTLGALGRVIDGRETIYDPDRNNFGGHFGFAWDPFAASATQAGKTAVRGGFGVYYDVTLGSVVSQSRNVFPSFVPVNVDVNTFAYAQDAFFQPGQSGIFAIFNPSFVPVDVISGGGVINSRLIRPGQLNQIGVPSGAVQPLLGLLLNPGQIDFTLASGGGLAFTLPDRGLRSPYAMHFNLQVERELAPDLLANFAYVGSRGLKLTRFRTPNGGPNSPTFPVDPLGLTPQPVFALALPPLSDFAAGRLGRPEAALGAYTIFDSSAQSNYHALQLGLTKRFSRGFQLTAAYTWSHAIDDVSDVFDVAGAFALPQDDRDLRAERGDANFDVRHRFVVSTVADLPFTTRFNSAVGARRVLLGGWQWASIWAFQTGQPFTVNTSFDINLDGNLTDRIETTNGLELTDTRQVRLTLTRDPGSLLATIGTNGQVGRNVFRSSGVAKVDLTVIKNFRVSETNSLVFRVEAFNLFNRTHFGSPVRILEAPSFGRSVETAINPRQIQFALKYIF